MCDDCYDGAIEDLIEVRAERDALAAAVERVRALADEWKWAYDTNPSFARVSPVAIRDLRAALDAPAPEQGYPFEDRAPGYDPIECSSCEANGGPCGGEHGLTEPAEDGGASVYIEAGGAASAPAPEQPAGEDEREVQP